MTDEPESPTARTLRLIKEDIIADYNKRLLSDAAVDIIAKLYDPSYLVPPYNPNAVPKARAAIQAAIKSAEDAAFSPKKKQPQKEG